MNASAEPAHAQPLELLVDRTGFPRHVHYLTQLDYKQGMSLARQFVQENFAAGKILLNEVELLVHPHTGDSFQASMVDNGGCSDKAGTAYPFSRDDTIIISPHRYSPDHEIIIAYSVTHYRGTHPDMQIGLTKKEPARNIIHELFCHQPGQYVGRVPLLEYDFPASISLNPKGERTDIAVFCFDRELKGMLLQMYHRIRG